MAISFSRRQIFQMLGNRLRVDEAAPPPSTLLTGLVVAWNFDSAEIATARNSNYPTGASQKTLTQTGSIQMGDFGADVSGSGAAAYENEGTAGTLYLDDQAVARLAQFTIASWWKFPGLDLPYASARLPEFGWFDSGACQRASLYWTAGAGEAFCRCGMRTKNAAGTTVVTTVVGNGAHSGEFDNWFFWSIRYNGTTVTADVVTYPAGTRTDYLATIDPTSGLFAEPTSNKLVLNRISAMGSDSTNFDALNIWSRALSQDEFLVASTPATAQHPFA